MLKAARLDKFYKIFSIAILVGVFIFCYSLRTSIVGITFEVANTTRSLAPGGNKSIQNSKEVTVVTAYFHLGKFEKGTGSNYFYTPDIYHKWISLFTLIKNPVVCYLERSSPFIDHFKKLRSIYPNNMTRIIEVNRSELWSFGLVPQIAKIFSRPGYPKHSPNTVLPEYSAAMHAKYELLQRTIQENPFGSIHFAWLDVGLFRDVVNKWNKTFVDNLPQNLPDGQSFRIVLPRGFEPKSIAYTSVGELRQQREASALVIGNEVWVCGAFFIGCRDSLLTWIDEYQWGVEKMMNESNYMSTDQQVIYWLYSNREKMDLTTKIQTYSGSGYDPWFYLGYISRQFDK